MDPSNQFLYVASTLSVIKTGANSGEIDGYAMDQTTGSVQPLAGGPMPFTDPIGCIQFEPTGKFGYTTSSNSTTNLLLTFSRDPKTGVLTQIGSTTLNNPPTGVAIDPLGTYLFTATVPDTNPPTALHRPMDTRLMLRLARSLRFQALLFSSRPSQEGFPGTHPGISYTWQILAANRSMFIRSIEPAER
jgi:hypothetical protein